MKGTATMNVRYHYVGPSGVCDGLATATLRHAGKSFLIKSIAPLSGR